MPKKKEAFASPFVPEEEQPYPIPENWCWTYGGIVLEDMESKRPVGNEFDYIDIDAIDNQKQTVNNPKRLPVLKAPSRASRKLHAGDTVFSLVRPYLKNIAYIDDSLAHCIASTGFFVCTPKSLLNSRYLYQLMISPYMVDGLNQYMKGDNSPSIRKDDIEQFPFPLPPLTEQQRIVSRIENLFAKLDEAKEKAQVVVDGFELRKSAILHKAFTGELTERWRKEHGVGLDSWTDTTIGKQAKLITKGASPRWQGVEYTDDKSQTLFVTSENVREGYLDFTKEKYLSNEINDIQKRSVLNYGDVLVNIVGASIGRAAIYNLHQLANTNQAVCIVRLKAEISNEFVCAYFNSPMAQSFYYDNKVETARANVSLSNISAMPIKLPLSVEQQEIVDILTTILKMEQQGKEAAEAVLDQIDIMKKTILARAFRGELGTNDPEEEWAGELLKKMR